MFSFNDSQVGIFKVFVILSFFTAKLHGRHNRALVTNKRRATIEDDFLSESTRRKKPNKRGCDYERILTNAIRQEPLSDWEKDCVCILGELCCDVDPHGYKTSKCNQCKDCIYENKLLN